eukprot:GHVL01017836.1.p1 GENE.GHVL01017836.1~~GHVL01017836.1.p1  ORF type:complete len:194 (-),score=33.73 GHVL01017836.1:87-668(-)
MFPLKWTSGFNDGVQCIEESAEVKKHILDYFALCGGGLDPARITNIKRIENHFTWFRYRAAQGRVRTRINNAPITKIALPVPKCCEDDESVPDGGINEVYLFHGTPMASAASIIQIGLDGGYAKGRAYDGGKRGLFCSNQLARSMGYSNGAMFICRVILGNPGAAGETTVIRGIEYVTAEKDRIYVAYVIYFK